MTDPSSPRPVRVQPAVAERWPDVAAVMGTRGDPSRCWCQYFRLRGRAWREASAADNEAALCDQVGSASAPPGVLAYRGDEPVGWCAIAPKRDYPRVVASRITGDDLAGVWAVTCFVVRVGHRRQGIAAKLLAGAVALARDHNAAAVEAYPVDASARGSVSAAELFHGTLSLYLGAGFTETARPSTARAVVRLDL